jgi:hypothetical protein
MAKRNDTSDIRWSGTSARRRAFVAGWPAARRGGCSRCCLALGLFAALALYAVLGRESAERLALSS